MEEALGNLRPWSDPRCQQIRLSKPWNITTSTSCHHGNQKMQLSPKLMLRAVCRINLLRTLFCRPLRIALFSSSSSSPSSSLQHHRHLIEPPAIGTLMVHVSHPAPNPDADLGSLRAHGAGNSSQGHEDRTPHRLDKV